MKEETKREEETAYKRKKEEKEGLGYITHGSRKKKGRNRRKNKRIQ